MKILAHPLVRTIATATQSVHGAFQQLSDLLAPPLKMLRSFHQLSSLAITYLFHNKKLSKRFTLKVKQTKISL